MGYTVDFKPKQPLRYDMTILDTKYSFLNSSLVRLLLPLFLLANIATFQYYFDFQRQQRPILPSTIIPAKVIKLGNLGLDSTVSALMWIYTIQKLGEYPKQLPAFIKIINDLDPRFSYPYAFSAVILPIVGFSDQAVEISLRGIREADPDWRIPYYLATTYHIFFEDREKAAVYFDLAARVSGAPSEVKAVASNYGTSKTLREQTKKIWTSIYEITDDEIVQDQAKNYLIQIETIELLEKAIVSYKQRFGFLPKELSDLADKKIIKAIPPNPFSLKYQLEKGGRVIVR